MQNNFIHLKTQSSYSLSESAIKIDKLVELTKQSNMPAVALTDNNNMFGALEFSMSCYKNGIQPIIGTSINLISDQITKKQENGNIDLNQISLLAKNKIGYQNLLFLSSKSHIESIDNVRGIKINDVIKNKEGLILFIGGLSNPLLHMHKRNKINQIKELISLLKNEFNEDFLFEIQRIKDDQLDKFEEYFINLSIDYNIPLIATNNVQFPSPDYYEAHDSLLCIAEKKTLNQDNRKISNPNVYFKTTSEMYELFKDIPDAIGNTYNVALKCNYAPNIESPKFPKFISQEDLTEEQELERIAINGLKIRLKNTNNDTYLKRLKYELEIINKMGFAGYFLIVSDIIKWAKKEKIPVGPGRGSGAGSVVSWALTITDLDPIKYGLIFERFLNPERISLPDFDIDFCQYRRDEVVSYVAKKYGNNSVAHIITFGTLASRAVVRDLGRVFGVPYNEVDKFSKMIPYNPANPISLSKSIDIDSSLQSAIKNDDRFNKIIDLGIKLEGMHRHASTHAAGIVISDIPLQKIVPLYKDPNTEKITTQYSMKYVELSGLIKFDFLGLTTLTIIDKAVNLITFLNKDFKLSDISMEDEKTFKMLSSGKTTGVFQLESSGMKDVLKRLKPDRFEDIIAVVALFRPGPMENITLFCNRKHQNEKIDYLHNLLEPVLKETYGIIVYQEQVMQIAQILSGYSLGEADILRKAMGKKITKEMKDQKNKFVDGAIKKGLNTEQASFIFDLVDKFAGYGFNKSHAACYALIAYQTAFLKCHFPEEFLVSSMNLSINKTENLVMFKKEINELNINLLKPDINYSNTEFSIEINENKKSIRFGLAAIKGVGYKAMQNLVKERKNNKYSDIMNFISRLGTDVINKKQLEKLIQAGSFDSIEKNRSFLFNNVTNLISISNSLNKNNNQSSLFLESDNNNMINNLKNYKDWPISQKLQFELETIGFYFSQHPLSLYSKEVFKLLDIYSYKKITEDYNCIRAKVVGSILDVKERTSKDGNKYAFITISDIDYQYDLTIFGDVFRRYKDMISEGNVLVFSIDISSRDGSNRRFIIREIDFLENKIKSKSFKHEIQLNSMNDLEIIRNYLIEKKSNNNKILLSLRQNGYKVCISLGDMTIINELEFNNILKLNNISRTVSFYN